MYGEDKGDTSNEWDHYNENSFEKYNLSYTAYSFFLFLLLLG